MAIPLTPSLNEVNNDTGRTAYCGPTVVSAITGYSISRIEAEIHAHRGDGEAADRIIKGTTTADVQAVLAVFGYGMDRIADYQHLEPKARPTVWAFMLRPRSAFAHYILAIQKGREGHWISIKGGKICDTYTGGHWEFASYGPHRGCRVLEEFVVRKTTI
jgi:hypothetical protein